MILCLDVGNSQTYGGVFNQGDIVLRFRQSSKAGHSSDETGVFLRSVLKENQLDPELIEKIAICTVVPESLHSLKNAARKYFNEEPFVLQAGVKTGLKIKYKNPLEVGADRIANAIAATKIYPKKNIIIIDFGTATTFCAISKEAEYLGGVITAGVRISMEALESRTSKLPSVEIFPTKATLGRGTVESIQSGLYHGTIGAIRQICKNISEEVFSEDPPIVLGTGGFASLFQQSEIFDEEIPDLVLFGIHQALHLNLK
ncbi:MAG: type III pantothenate kinase [Bdellovibrionales bacterium]|nr:type III pantothenate kinase [Bdellovibrionales bacterium]